MVAAISASMSAALNNLLDVNNDIDRTQNWINTGKTVNNPSDNIALYFRARSYNDKADLYKNVNSNITQGVANLDFVDKALSNMIDNVKGARQMLADAKAKPSAASTAVAMTGQTVYANTTVTVGATTRTIRGQIVDPTSGPGANANISNGAYFSNGDIFQVNIVDTATNTPLTRYFKAVGPDGALPDQTKTGNTSANAIEFNDLASLANALNLGFGRATASFDVVTNGSGVQLKMALGSASQSITFGQSTDANQGGALGTGSSFDFSSLLQNASFAGAALKNGDPLDATNAPNATSVTYSPKTGTTSDQSVIDARRQAADFYRQTIYGLDATVKDAYMPGYANVLKGETMTVALNDTGTVSQSVKVPTAVNFAGNAPTFGVGFSNVGGVITTFQTDPATASEANFLSDNQLTAAINKLDAISIALGQQRQLLAASKTAMSSRLDLNKSMAAAMTDAANAMTAADIPSETASLSALQNRQSFAISGLAITRQAEQQLLALIR